MSPPAYSGRNECRGTNELRRPLRRWTRRGRRSAPSLPHHGEAVVGTSRCDVPGRVQRAERISRDERTTAPVAPLDAARTAQRAVPTTLELRLRVRAPQFL